ncbi:MAG: DUF4837 family protein [Bacteroidales bacterium]|jgi:hypothetical protein|nr:DUF4837 family protein [Bacteroidales bacterium]
MKKLFFLFVIVISFTLFSGCDGMGSQGDGFVSSSGRSGEVLVVCSDKQWKGSLGDSIHTLLMQPVLGLPQEEPMFTLSHISENRFVEAYKKQRNIIFFTIDTTIEQTKIAVNHNTWARPQLLIQVKAKNEQQAMETFSKYQKEIINYLLTSEMKRFQRAQRSKQNFYLSSEIEKLFNISIVIPEGFIFAVKDSSFVWLRKDTKEWTQNILIFAQDYRDTNQLKNEHIVSYRNTNTQKYVFGPMDGSYVVVDEQYIPTISAYAEFSEGYTVRTVGLWKMVKDFMGGPFVDMSILDAKNNRIVTVDGFLYAPSDDKRDLLRQLESVLLSVKFIQ